jgi:ABC-2 type transport system permease protein
MTGTLTVARLLLRCNRFRLAAWIFPLVLLVAVTVPGYAPIYPSLADRGPLVHQLRDTLATKVLYGQLPLPGTLGQLAQWETGTYVVLLVSVMAVLLAIALTRRDEDLGLTELVTTAGVGRWAHPCAAALVLAGTFAVLGGAVTAVLAVESVGHAGDLTVSGAACFGGVVALVGIGTAAQTMLLAQVLWDAHSAVRAAWTLVVIGFGARVLADFSPMTWLRWGTWFGLRDLVRPYTDDRVGPLVVAVGGVLILGAMSAITHAHREFGAGLVRPRSGGTRRLRISSAAGLAWRLDRGPLVLWALPTTAVAALFGGMSHGLIGLLRADAGTAGLLRTMTAAIDPVRQYFSFSYVFVALLPMVYGAATVLRTRADERAGLLDVELATGVARWRPLAARTAEAAAGALALLVLGSVVQAATALTALRGAPPSGATTWAFWVPLGQAPGILAAVGLAGLAVGAAPRLAGGVWAVIAWSGFAVLLGALARVPDGARRIALLGHLPVDPPALTAPAVLLVVLCAAAAVGGCAAMRTRDVVVG